MAGLRKMLKRLLMLEPHYCQTDGLRRQVEALQETADATLALQREERAAAVARARQEGIRHQVSRFLNGYDAKFASAEVPAPHWISYDYPSAFRNGAGRNLGDWMQSIAVEKAVRRVVGEDVRFATVRRDELVMHRGGTCVMQGWFEHGSLNFLPGLDTQAVWIGTHLSSQTREALKTLWDFDVCPATIPLEIGCRDRSTLAFCRELGVEAYFSRCLTLTLPRRAAELPPGKNVYLVDCPDWLASRVPEELRRQAVVLSQRKFRAESSARCRAEAERLLETYSRDARLVITTALHCAQPCVAMGIPVVVVNPGYREADRFSPLEGIVPVYSREELEAGKVDFCPEARDIEDLKELLLANLRLSAKADPTAAELAERQRVREAIAAYRARG